MNKWKEYIDYKEVKDICNIQKGRKAAKDAVKNGNYTFFTCSEDIKKIDCYSFDCEAILINAGGDIGKARYYNGKFETTNQVYILTNVKQGINILYLFHYLDTFFYDYAKKNNSSQTIPHIKFDIIQNFIVPIPPEEDQEYIAGICTDIYKKLTEAPGIINKDKVFIQEEKNRLLKEFMNIFERTRK